MGARDRREEQRPWTRSATSRPRPCGRRPGSWALPAATGRTSHPKLPRGPAAEPRCPGHATCSSGSGWPAPRGRRPPRACRPTGWPRCRPSWSPCWPGSRPPSRRPSGSGPVPGTRRPAGSGTPRTGPRPTSRPPGSTRRRAGRRRRPGPEPGGRRARRRARGGGERGRPHLPAGRRADAGVRRPGDRRAPLRRARDRPVTAAWVAGTVRARALARRRLGAVGARELARSAGLTEARSTLARTPYGDGLGGQELAPCSTRPRRPCCGTCGCSPGGCPATAPSSSGCWPAASRSPTSRSTCAGCGAAPPSRSSRWAPCRPPGHGSRPPPPRSSCGRWWPPPRGATRGPPTAPAASGAPTSGWPGPSGWWTACPARRCGRGARPRCCWSGRRCSPGLRRGAGPRSGRRPCSAPGSSRPWTAPAPPSAICGPRCPATPGGCSRTSRRSRTCGARRRPGGTGSSRTRRRCCGRRRTGPPASSGWSASWPPTPGGCGPPSGAAARAGTGRAREVFDALA